MTQQAASAKSNPYARFMTTPAFLGTSLAAMFPQPLPFWNLALIWRRMPSAAAVL
jgi:hypothetical protein